MKSLSLLLVTTILLLMGYDQPAETDSVSSDGGTIEAINHTHRVINHFSISGRSGVDITGLWQGGSGAGYFGVSPKWEPGVTVKVEWETGVDGSEGLLGFAGTEKYLVWEKK